MYDEGAGVAAGGDDGGGEGGQYQALRDLCGLRDFPPVFPHMPGLRLPGNQQAIRDNLFKINIETFPFGLHIRPSIYKIRSCQKLRH